MSYTASLRLPQDVNYLIRDFCTKQPAGTSRADGPRVHVFRIRPHEITKRSFVRDFLVPLDGSNLVQSLNVWGETSVDTQDLFIQQLRNKKENVFDGIISFYLSFISSGEQLKLSTYSCNCQHIKHLRAITPGICVPILGLTLVCKTKVHFLTLDEKGGGGGGGGHCSSIRCYRLHFTIKSIDLGNLSALVVSSQECDTVRPLGFQHQEVSEGLQTVVPSVDKIPLTSTLEWYILPRANQIKWIRSTLNWPYRPWKCSLCLGLGHQSGRVHTDHKTGDQETQGHKWIKLQCKISQTIDFVSNTTSARSLLLCTVYSWI